VNNFTLGDFEDELLRTESAFERYIEGAGHRIAESIEGSRQEVQRQTGLQPKRSGQSHGLTTRVTIKGMQSGSVQTPEHCCSAFAGDSPDERFVCETERSVISTIGWKAKLQGRAMTLSEPCFRTLLSEIDPSCQRATVPP